MMSMVLMLFIAFMYQGVFSVHGVPGVYGVLLHYCTTGCSFNCLSVFDYSYNRFLIVFILLGVHSSVY